MAKTIDNPTRFAAWLNEQFDAIEGGADHGPIMRQATSLGLRLGAGDVVGEPTDKKAALAALGKLIAWCRPEPGEELLWNRERAARQLSVSPRTVFSLTQSKKLPCVRVGGRVLYSPTALRAWRDEKASIAA